MVKTALTLSMTTRHLHLRTLSFGRRRPFITDGDAVAAPALSDDLRLFVLTYCTGFVFVSLYLA